MSAIKRHIEAYAEQNGMTFEQAQVALAVQQGACLSPIDPIPTPIDPTPPTTP